MSVQNNARIIVGRDLRNLVRSACTAMPGWHEWRAANLREPDGSLRDSGSMRTGEVKACAIALGVDIEAVAASHGVAVSYFDNTAKPGVHTSVASTPAASVTPPVASADTSDAPATSDTSATSTPAAPHAYEGRDVDALVREALAAADGMVGPKLFDMLVASVRPIAGAAVQGPRIVVRDVPRDVVRTVTVPVPVGAPVGDGSVRYVAHARTASGRDVFGVKASDAGQWRTVLDAPVNVYDGTPAEGVPAVDPHHVWDTEALAYLCLAASFADAGHRLRNMSRVLMYGPAGTGKTTGAQQFAAVTGRPFIRIAFDRTTEPAELVGQRMPKAGGGTEFRQGALVTAMQTPYAVVLLDEPSFLRPGAAAVLQTILDTGCVYLKEDGNRRVDLAPGVVIVAADNTNLTGDETGRYADTMAQNVALQDRFAYLVPLDYLSAAREAEVLVHRTGIARAAADAMVAFANTTRKGAATGQLTTGCSLRRLVAWATACVSGIPSQHAFKASVLNAADPADRETIRGLEKNCAPHGTIDAAVAGTAPVNVDTSATSAAPGATSTGQGAAAASVFASAPVTA